MILGLLRMLICVVTEREVINDRGAASKFSIVFVDNLASRVVLLAIKVQRVVSCCGPVVLQVLQLVLLALDLLGLLGRFVVHFVDVFDLF